MSEGEDLPRQKIHTLRLKAYFHRVILSFAAAAGEDSKNIIEGGSGDDLQALMFRIRTVYENVEHDLPRHGLDLNKFLSQWYGWKPKEITGKAYSILERLELLDSDVLQLHGMLSRRLISGMTHEAVMENVNFLLRHVQDLTMLETELIAPVKEELEAAQKGLRFLINFLGFITRRCSHSQLVELKDILDHAGFLVLKLSCLFYVYSVSDKMNVWTVNEMKMCLLSELQNFSPMQPEIGKMFIKALKASRSAQGNSPMVVDESGLGFLDSLRDTILELANSSMSSFMASNKDQILFLHEELLFLTLKLSEAHKYFRHIEPAMSQLSNNFMEHISNVIIDMACLIYSLHNTEDKAKELKVAVSDLKEIVKIANEEARSAYDTYIPKSWQVKTKFLTTNAKATICWLKRNLEEIMIHSSDFENGIIGEALCLGLSPYSLPCHLSNVLQKEMQLLNRVFIKFTSEQQLGPEEVEVNVIRLNDIRNRTKNLVSSFSRGFGRRNFPVFFLIEEIQKIIKEFEGLQNQMIHNTFSDAEIFEDEAEKIGEQLNKESQVLHSLPIHIGTVGIEDCDSNLDLISPQKDEVKAIKVKMIEETSVHSSCFSTQVSVESSLPKNNIFLSSEETLPNEKNMTKLPIFEEEAMKIRDQLTNQSKELNIISIVGMPGIGKTTLADSVFESSLVIKHFHVRARCSVSQVYDRSILLREILHQVAAGITKYDENDADRMLYQNLKGRRYLILMDDVWSIRLWKDIKISFPDDGVGSRIIFTSRIDDIAIQTGLKNITNYALLPLSEQKSWEMLQAKLFGSGSFPSKIERVGRKIATNCQGLPLTIVLVAGLLREKEEKEWNIVAENLMRLLLEDSKGICPKVLELSYGNLPDHMKPCFLYFAAFPEDANVPSRELILLWIAEGFVQSEDVAEDILNNLINRNLITVSTRSPLGRVDATRVHDLLHEFAVAKAHKESFMLKIDGKTSTHDELREQYRLCIYPNNWRRFIISNPSGPRTRTLISPAAPFGETFSLNFRAFELLQVLYIPPVRLRYCPEMFTLIHLRVLAIAALHDSDAFIVTSKIHKLRNLETFIMYRGLSGQCVSLLLDKVLNVSRLRHFHFGGYISFQYLSERIWKMSSLFDNLRTLYNLRASYDEDIEKILKLIPNLVKLKAQFYSPDEDIYSFPKLDFLEKLESLKVTHKGKYPCKIINTSFPPNLKELVLSNFCLPWTEISVLGNLESVEILVLENGAFKGPTWNMIDGQFPNLKYLSLNDLDIEEWIASEDHLSHLEQLHVEYCGKLKELPSSLKVIGKLKVIKLSFCSASCVNCAKSIKEEQEELGNEQLLIEIR